MTLDLAADLTGPDGQPAPAGMFSVSPDRVAVPAGATATATVHADTRVAGPEGRYAGRIVATDGETVVGTPVAIDREVESYDLTVRVLDRTGAPTGAHLGILASWATNSDQPVHAPSGDTTIRLPKGDYTLGEIVWTGGGEPDETISVLAAPRLTLTRDVTVVVDARAAKSIEVTVPDPSARFAYADVGFDIIYPHINMPVSVSGQGLGYEGVFSARLGDPAPAGRFVARAAALLADPGENGDFFDSPYAYNLSWFEYGGMLDGLTRHVRQRDLAVVHADYFGPIGHYGRIRAHPVTSDGAIGGWDAPSLATPLPHRRTEFYQPHGVRWSSMFMQTTTAAGPTFPESLQQGPAREYRAGHRYSERWNGAVFGPAVPDGVDSLRLGGWAVRNGDQLLASIGLFADAAPDHGSFSLTVDQAHTVLYHNGEQIAESPNPGDVFADVPPDDAVYRVDTEAVRGSTSDVSTRVAASWSFRSRHEAGTDPARLPIMAVRFTPALDDENAAPAGRPQLIPVRVQHQAGAPAGRVSSLTIEVSYDDGTTWHPVALTSTRDGWLARVVHPADAGFVSLRAGATDSLGSTVRQTIIRAYKLRR